MVSLARDPRLSRLSVQERQLILTDCCPEFTHLLADMLKSHENSGGNCLISAHPTGSGKQLDAGQIKIYQPSYPADLRMYGLPSHKQ